MKGRLKVAKSPPHFLQLTLKIELEESMDNLHLNRSASATTIERLQRDERSGVYVLDYLVPLHTPTRSSAYLVDDMVSLEQLREGEKPKSARNDVGVNRARSLPFPPLPGPLFSCLAR